MTQKNTSRFCQLNAVALMEYKFNNVYTEETTGEYGMYPLSKFSPCVYTLVTGEKLYSDTKQPEDFITGNGVDITSIPFDLNASLKYHITETDATYEDYEEANASFGSRRVVEVFDSESELIPFDDVKIYYVSGYDFEELGGVCGKIYLNCGDGTTAIICQLTLTKSMLSSKMKYLERPLILSNRIYDKYIEIRVPSVKYLATSKKTSGTLVGYLNIDEGTPVHVQYGEIYKEHIKEYSNVEYDTIDVVDSIREAPKLPKDAILYTVSNEYTSAFPQYANSDNLTASLVLDKKSGSLTFHGEWLGKELNPEIVSSFNTKIILYDVGKKERHVNLYDADSKGNMEWIGYHEIIAKFYDDNGNIIDELPSGEKINSIYNFTQPFEPTAYKLYNSLRFKPIVNGVKGINNAVFEYNFRLINLYDDVQFLRTSTLTVSGDDVYKYFANTLQLDFSGIKNYNVFNKIEKVNQTITTPISSPMSTQYTKVFYNISDIVLDNDGNYIGDGNYVLNLSDSPRNYKFKFRKYDADGNLVIMDLSEYTLVLYTRNNDNKDIVIEPTYSSNMNLIMGEIEFNISANNILKLKDVDTNKRFMSILVINNDNTKYSMFDFTYE